MIERLTTYGFVYSRSCSCEGFKTHIYKRGDYEVKVRVKRNMFKIKHHGITKTNWLPESVLQIKIDEITPMATA